VPPFSGLPAVSRIVLVPLRVTVYWPSTFNAVLMVTVSVSVPQPPIESGMTGLALGATMLTSPLVPVTTSEKVKISTGDVSLVILSAALEPVSSVSVHATRVGGFSSMSVTLIVNCSSCHNPPRSVVRIRTV